MVPARGSWRKQALAWPLISGALFGMYVAWQFAAPDFASRLLGCVLGVLCSLPFGALLGVIAIGVGHAVLVFVPPDAVGRRSVGWRFAFGIATGIAVALTSVIPLMWIGIDAWGLSAGAVVGAVAFVAACSYFPGSERSTTGTC